MNISPVSTCFTNCTLLAYDFHATSNHVSIQVSQKALQDKSTFMEIIQKNLYGSKLAYLIKTNSINRLMITKKLRLTD